VRPTRSTCACTGSRPARACGSPGQPTDCAVYVWEGSVDAGGARLDAGSSAVVEYGASLSATAGPEGAALLVFRMRDRSPEERAGGHVHLLPQERVARVDEVNGY
jgi:hypothetical protein